MLTNILAIGAFAAALMAASSALAQADAGAAAGVGGAGASGMGGGLDNTGEHSTRVGGDHIGGEDQADSAAAVGQSSDADVATGGPVGSRASPTLPKNPAQTPKPGPANANPTGAPAVSGVASPPGAYAPSDGH